MQTSSKTRGGDTSVEVVGISSHGLWLYAQGDEYFLAYEEYPWFRDATVAQICHVELSGAGHLYWPELDVDLSTAILKNPGKYPLTYRAG